MSFPSLFALLLSGAPMRRRRAWRSWLPGLVIALAGLLGSSMAQATIHTFNGINDYYSCTRSGMVYTCTSPAYLDWDDGVVIANGVTLRVTTNVTVGYNQSLQMIGTAKLIVTGNLNIGDVNPPNLKIADGTSIEVSGSFSMGAQAQTIGADVTANTMNLGTNRVTVNGNLNSRGTIAIGSYATINGNVSGTAITTASPVAINGNVLATTSFSLASGSKVTGNVDTGSLVLESSEALITGTATVTAARLEWHGRVAGTIYCRNGTAKNKCDCVTNNSGYDINKTNGPVCESMPAPGPRHFLITHDGSGDTCVPEKVTITACADATCTAYYTKGVSGQLSPWNTPFTIAAGQSSVQVSATQIAAGTHALDIASSSVAPTSAEVCRNTAANSNSCNITFAGGAKLLIEVPNHVAGVPQLALIKAVKANDTATMCVAAFANETYTVKYTCTYGKPTTGTKALTLDGTALTCNAASTVNQTRITKFDEEGVADMTLAYPDAGELALAGSVTTKNNLVATGSVSFTTVPAKFTLAVPAAPLRAGASVDLTVTAVNSAGAATLNFDTDRLNAASASAHGVAVDIDCRAQDGELGTFGVGAVKFVNGVATVPTSWSEVGKIDLKASLSDFLGVKDLNAGGTTKAVATGCSGNVGPFIPQYFKVELAETARGFYYSKEPFTLQVSAMNKAGAVTKNYNKTLKLDEAITLTANDANGTAFSPVPGDLSGHTIAERNFDNGVAMLTPTYTFKTRPTRPTRIRLRAVNGKTGTSEVTSGYGTAFEAAETGAMPEIRSGRLRIGNAFGGRGSTLSLPLMAEYWTGNSWMINTDDNFTSIPTSAVAITSIRQASSTAGSVPFRVRPASTGNLVLVKGVKPLLVDEASGGSGWGDVAINLGVTGAKDTSCVGTHPDVTPAVRDWLRAAGACVIAGVIQTADRDPSGRATFGVYPETKRVIHVREVFR